MTRRLAAIMAMVAICATISFAACERSHPPGSTERRDGASGTSASGTATALGTSRALGRSQWAVNDGRLAIVVRNDGSRTVRSARAIITARDSRGDVVAVASGRPYSPCCTVTGLPAQHDYALYYDLGRSAQRVRSVSVSYADVTRSPAAAPPTASVANVSLQTGTGGTVVRASLTMRGAPDSDVVGQAVLTGPTGALVSVVAGRLRCLRRGETRIVRLALRTSVPAGTIVGSVWAFAEPARPSGCAAATSAR